MGRGSSSSSGGNVLHSVSSIIQVMAESLPSQRDTFPPNNHRLTYPGYFLMGGGGGGGYAKLKTTHMAVFEISRQDRSVRNSLFKASYWFYH